MTTFRWFLSQENRETPILKNRRTLLSAEPTNKPSELKPNQPVSLPATLPAGPARNARNKDGVFTWLIEKVQSLCGSTFVLYFCKLTKEYNFNFNPNTLTKNFENFIERPTQKLVKSYETNTK